MSFDRVDELAVNTLRTLAMDAVEKAASGHPGAPMGLAPVAYVLFNRFLKHDPGDPRWPDRDRFVLSCGHASMLLYGILHLTGYDLGIDDLKAFRQWGSRTPGHPEHGLAPGVEVSTGPLGQGCGASVGMAIAEANLAERFNRPGHTVVNHRTWVLCSDGDLMEGVSSEAASLAGHLRLGKLAWIWDDNRITIEGSTDLAFSEEVERRFQAYGWSVVRVEDANDLPSLAAAFEVCRHSTDRPTLVAVRSEIAYGAPKKHGSADAHGSPLGAAEVAGAKAALGWPPEASFLVPGEVIARCHHAVSAGQAERSRWTAALDAYRSAYPELASEWVRRNERRMPEGWERVLPSFAADAKGLATREASGKVLNALAPLLPELVGGSADLSPSCKTTISGAGSFGRDEPGGRNLHFGVREHGMGAVLNGMALHGFHRPFGSTFLVFSDYMRPSIRLACLMAQPVIYVFTHDSVWVGEDGPTHQPVEHLLCLRAIPGIVVLRPADANETAAAWRLAIERNDGPVALILSRQRLPVLEGTAELAPEGVRRGAYVLLDGSERPEVVVIGTGSEVPLVVAAARRLSEAGLAARVVSMPSVELFQRQPATYRDELLPPGVPTLAVEAGVSRGWREVVGDRGGVVGIDRFGASAPAELVAAKLGLSVENVVARALELVGEGGLG